MPNLADSYMATQFVEKLERCESASPKVLDFWERQFVSDMRMHFDERETQLDMGMNPWNPSVGQWNQLQMIAEKIR